MPTTPKGLPYPASTAPPNVPADLQALAEAVDPWLSLGKRKLSNESVTNSVAMQDDDELSVALGVGVWRVEAFLHASGPAAADIQTAWTFSGATNGTNRACIGPGVGTASAINGAAVRTSVHALTTAVPYGVDGSVTSAIHEDLYLIVTTAGTLRLQWAQATANATASVMASGSRLYATRLSPAA
jgi:hypothetical protein